MQSGPTNELVLIESRSLRDQTIERTDVLDKVKALVTLPNGFHVTTQMVATYFEVPVETIKSVVEDNRAELEERGYRVLRGAELTEFASPFGGPANLGLSPMARSLALFTRKAVLNIGQLLTKSEVSRQIRTYLLDVEEAQHAAPQFQIPQTLSEALRFAADEHDRAESLKAELASATAVVQELTPKAEVYDDLIQHGANRTVGEVAKELSTPERKVMEGELRRRIIHEWRWAFQKLRECGSTQYTPYAHRTDYLVLGEEKYPHNTRPDCWHATMRITPMGREAIRQKLDKEAAKAQPAAAPRIIAPAPTEAEIVSMIRRGA
ncbi:phage antirepressor KilAC domain-containing protein [Streptomyces sp. NPDC002574]|uniref:phage antirepressor KilAC domain-containing protein n=1 Tax=Streptomyces sp. NPDC002574 TaxID=3364652 RepID=UPI0036B0334F